MAANNNTSATQQDTPFILDAFYNLGRQQQTRNELQDAELSFQRALKGYQALYGPQDLNTLDTTRRLAEIYRLQGQLTKSMEIYEQALSRITTKDVLQRPILDDIYNLGNEQEIRNQFHEAEQPFRRSFEGYKVLYGLQHSRTIDAANGLGRVLRWQGKLEEAEAIIQTTLDTCRDMKSVDTKLTLEALFTLGLVQADQNHWKEAEDLFRQALTGHQRVYFPWDHKVISDSLFHLGRACNHLDKSQEAEFFFRQALAGYSRHPSLSKTYHPMGIAAAHVADRCYHHKKYREAELFYEQALDISKAVYGEENPFTLDLAVCLGRTYSAQEKFMAAGLKLKWVLDTCRRTIRNFKKPDMGNSPPPPPSSEEEDHQKVMMKAMNDLYIIHEKQKNLDAAVYMMERLVNKSSKIFDQGRKNIHTLIYLNNLARLYIDQGNYLLAKNLLREAQSGCRRLRHFREVRRELLGRDSDPDDEPEEITEAFKLMPFIRFNWAVLWTAQGRSPKKFQYQYRSAWMEFMETRGYVDEYTLEAIYRDALLQRTCGDHGDATGIFMLAMKGYESYYGEEDHHVLDAVRGLESVDDEDAPMFVTQWLLGRLNPFLDDVESLIDLID
ncbi:MAG: 40S ribosomal protein S19 [Watsoniomyces obsoletus]|nr:MAG: 40S ribosomal protein S19 [Watsoniomyces obsoletus]